MGYFEALTSTSFKKDGEGKTVFFPWGVVGRGRVLPDEAAETKVRAFVSRFYHVSIPVTIAVGVVVGWGWALLLVPVFAGWFYFGLGSQVAGCLYSEDTLTLREAYANSAACYGRFTLWVQLICSLLFVVLGLSMATTTRSLGQSIQAWFSVVFFGGCGVGIGYMLKVKNDA